MNRNEKIIFCSLIFFLLTGISLQIYRHRSNRIDFLISKSEKTFPIQSPSIQGSSHDPSSGRKYKPKSLADHSININHASVPELMFLPKIGKKRAEDIVAYRKKNGPFRQKTDLLKIRGIGPATYKKIAPYIVINETKPRNP